MENQSKTNSSLLYQVNDKPQPLSWLLLAFQHIFAAFGGIIVVPIVVAAGLKLDAAESTLLISSAILMAGVASFIQSKGIGPVGARVACIMGTDFTFATPAIAVGTHYGLAGIFGATIMGAILVILASFFVQPLMRLFPPLVTGTVITLIGLTLLPVSIDWAAGGVGSKDYGDLKNISIALIVMFVTLLLNRYGKGLISSASILIGMIFGFLICLPLGLVNFNQVVQANWFSFPQFFAHGITLNFIVLLPFLPAYFVSIIGTVGNLKGIGEVSGLKLDDKQIGRGVLSDGVGSLLAGIVGIFPNTSFSQNVGLIPLTKVASRYVTLLAGILMVGLGLLPKFAALVDSLPSPVLGGVGVVMFGTVAAAGIKTLSRIKLTNRNLLIVATSLGLGLGVTFRPELLTKLPSWLSMIFSSGISTGTLTALLLNVILKAEED